ncbi:K+-transporting ATPase ATPase C chain [Streptacidiphilus sp. MAP12-16]|uniref:potassium-transporting ATPase subunit C n=1 Tax=Streptacidiphilus sp. MAP12-16 TaxID=3156300 RepID=UPI00351163D8
MRRTPHWAAQHLAAVRVVLVLTVVVGLLYPLAMTAFAQLPDFRHQAHGSLVTAQGRAVGSSLIGQNFTDAKGNPLIQYFQPRPSAAGNGYDPTASGASNLGPESVVDQLPTAGQPNSGKPSLLTQVCARSLAVGQLEHVDGSRPYCTPDGVGAVLGVYRSGGLTGAVTRVVSLNQACPTKPFLTSYQGVAVQCAKPTEDYSAALTVPVRGNAPANPVVPPDAVTASASGLDPQIGPAYARLQAARVANARGMRVADVLKLVSQYTTGRALGVLGEPGVNVLELNLALDRSHPYPAKEA